MDIRQLTARLDQIENNRLYEGLTLTEAKSVKLWETAGRLIKEAALTPDQIQQLFTSVEQGATAAGGNRTMIGQGKDAAEAIKKAYDDLVSKVQNSGPVKGADAMYDQAVAKIEAGLGGPDNAVNQVIQKYRAFAKEHPIAQGLIYSILIAAAGISGVGLGGAAVLGLLKMTDKLLQGEKFSTAVGKGLATGATAYAAGQIGQALKGPPQGDAGASGSNADRMYNKLAAQHQAAADRAASVGGSGTISQAAGTSVPNASALQGLASDPDLSPIAQKLASDLASGKNVTGASEYLNKALHGAAQRASMMGDMPDGSANAAQREFMSLHNLMKAAIDTPAMQMKESFNLSESTIATLFTLVQIKNRQFNEGMWDNIKNKAATVGKNLTTKVTADKLNSAWTKAGSPTDSDAVAQILQSAGVDPAVVSKSYTDMGIAAPTGNVDREDPPLFKDKEASQPDELAGIKKNAGLPTVNIKDMLSQILSLAPADQQQVLAYLKK